jgi:hypothetical protein
MPFFLTMPLSPRLLSLATAAILIAGCASAPHESYKITLKDGREYMTNSRPELQRKTGYYRYKNFEKRDALLRADEVLLIEQQGS